MYAGRKMSSTTRSRAALNAQYRLYLGRAADTLRPLCVNVCEQRAQDEGCIVWHHQGLTYRR